jgi:hypothetical protein
MAIVTAYGTGYKNPASLSAINTRNRGAESRAIVSVVTPTAGDNATSRYFVGTIPSNAILDPSSSVISGVTGFTAADLGFTNAGGGALLGAGLNLNAAAVLPLPLLQAAANIGKAAWQVAGLAADPGGELDVVLVPSAGTGLAAPVAVILKYFNQ